MENNSNPDIKIRAYKYALAIMKLVDSFAATKNSRSFSIIVNQLLRAATSVGANIIESQAGSSKRDFINFMLHALKSANECKFWLGLLRDGDLASADQINPLLDETKEIANVLASIVLRAKGK